MAAMYCWKALLSRSHQLKERTTRGFTHCDESIEASLLRFVASTHYMCNHFDQRDAHGCGQSGCTASSRRWSARGQFGQKLVQ